MTVTPEDDGVRERRLAALKEEIAARTGELEASETKRRELEADLAEARAGQLRAESELRVARAARLRLETDIAEARAELEQLGAALIEAEAARGELVRRFGEVMSSTSWRVTAPLRKVVGRMRRDPGKAEERGQ